VVTPQTSKVQTFDMNFALNPSVALKALIRSIRRMGFDDMPHHCKVIQSDMISVIQTLEF